MSAPKDPVLIYLDGAQSAPDVANAPVVTDAEEKPQGAAMQTAAHLATRRPSRIMRWLWRLIAAFVGLAVSVAIWDFVISSFMRSPILGWTATVVVMALLALLSLQILYEVAAFARLSRVGRFRCDAEAVRATEDPDRARILVERLVQFYAYRPETGWGRARLAEARSEVIDAVTLVDQAEIEILGPLDEMARHEVEVATRRVATVTALLPLALADVATALITNLHMIRRIAEIYGGRPVLFGTWRLVRHVLSHLVATGAMAAGDDLLTQVFGGTLLAKLSGRFGEGLVNGMMTARVGLSAMEVCRPLPFSADRRPSVLRIVKDGLSGLIPGRET